MNQVLCSIRRFQSKEEWQALVSVSFLPSRGLLSREASTCRLGMLHRPGGKGYGLNNLASPSSPQLLQDAVTRLLLTALALDQRSQIFAGKKNHFLLNFTEILLGISFIDAAFVAPVHVKLRVTQFLRC